MATRMQQRRGTAAQWISTNSGNGPILNAGEIGYETDTNKFKIGDGTNHWINLDYFIDANSTANPSFGSSITFEGATSNDFETVLQVTDPTADRTITFPDATGTVLISDINGNVTVPGNVIVNGATTIINSTILEVQNEIKFEGATADGFETSLKVVDPTADRDITFPDATGTVALLNATQTFDNKSISLSGNTVTGTLAEFNTALSDGNFATLAGVETLTSKTLTSPKINEDVTVTATATEINVLDGITASTAELNILDGVTATAAQINVLTSLTSSAAELNILDGATLSTAELNILDGVTITSAEINVLAGITATSAELNILDGATLSVTELNYVDGVTSAIQTQLDNKQAKVTDVSDTEIGYLNGVTSAIQTQIDGKQATVAGVSDVEIGYLDGVTSAIQTQLNNKQAVVANVSDTEIGYLDGVTSAIQTQIDGKASTSHTHVISDVTNLQTSLDAKAALSGATFTGAVVLAADPATALGAATKQYVDSIAEGLHVHASVVAATTANITLATDVENGDTLDGVTLATGNRILVKNQSTASQNGIYVVAASGAPSRAADFDSSTEIDGGDFVFVTGGTINDNSGWVQTNTVGTVGTDAIEFSQFAGSGTVTAGTNISVSGNQISVISNPTFSGLVTASASGVAFSDGTQTKEGVPSLTPIIQKTASYTLSSLTERDSLVEVASASATTITIPLNSAVAYPVGTSVDILQTSTGQVTIAGAVGVTVNATPGLKLRAQWSSCTLFKRATDTWIVMGDLSA